MIACVAAVACALVLAGCGGGSNPSSAPSSVAPATTVAPTTVTPSTVAPTTTTTIDPGSLPQTDDEPSLGSGLQAQMQALWAAIVSGSVDGALPVFFPETAYVSMKTGLLPDPASDYTSRLIAFYGLDIAAYHQLIVSSASTPTLTGVSAEAADAAWIAPGACENSIGYWHLPGVRLVYTEGSTVKSVGVASLISWRGVWYVVHLGPNPRPTDAGTVDQPADGPGTPGPAGGC